MGTATAEADGVLSQRDCLKLLLTSTRELVMALWEKHRGERELYALSKAALFSITYLEVFSKACLERKRGLITFKKRSI